MSFCRFTVVKLDMFLLASPAPNSMLKKLTLALRVSKILRNFDVWDPQFLVRKLSNTFLCLLPIAYCLLPIAYCLLPIAYCLLPIAYCLLPIAYCPVFVVVVANLFELRRMHRPPNAFGGRMHPSGECILAECILAECILAECNQWGECNRQ